MRCRWGSTWGVDADAGTSVMRKWCTCDQVTEAEGNVIRKEHRDGRTLDSSLHQLGCYEMVQSAAKGVSSTPSIPSIKSVTSDVIYKARPNFGLEMERYHRVQDVEH